MKTQLRGLGAMRREPTCVLDDLAVGLDESHIHCQLLPAHLHVPVGAALLGLLTEGVLRDGGAGGTARSLQLHCHPLLPLTSSRRTRHYGDSGLQGEGLTGHIQHCSS